MILFVILSSDANVEIPETCEQNEVSCEPEAPENKVKIEFLEENYQKVVDQKYGNIPMEIFRQRVKFVINYRSEIADYLETESYRYQLTVDGREKVKELIDQNSYSSTIENIHGWISDNIEYSSDRNWYTAQSTWQKKSANCNGISFLTCGMMREIGIPCIVVANNEHAWTEYLYLDDQGRLVWNIWDQGLEGYPAIGSNVYEYDLS